MEKATATDLIVDSHGKCFFCCHSTLSPTSLEHSSNGKYTYPEFHSLHYLYRYLGMNIRKMGNSSQLNFNQNVPLPLVKVYLCEECSEENALFGKLYQQLVKIQMELISSLESIHMKLASDDKSIMNSYPAHVLSSTNDFTEKLEHVQTARQKTKEKCYSKLKSELPRIPVKRLSAKMMRSSLADKKSAALKNMRDLRTDLSNRHTEEFASADATAVKIECVKVENSDEQDEMSDEGGDRDWLDDGTTSTSEHVKNVMKTERDGTIEVAGGYSYVVIKPAKLDEDLLKPMSMQSIVDSQTGQHQCQVCSKTFAHSRSFQCHYRCKHLNERYKCTYRQCGKTFNAQSSYYAHHQKMHIGIKFFCKVCKKGFGEKTNLRRHQRKTRCGKGLPPTPVKHSCRCHLCGKGFTYVRSLRRHHRTAHLQLKRIECDLCGMKFTRNDNLKDHRRNIHQKGEIK